MIEGLNDKNYHDDDDDVSLWVQFPSRSFPKIHRIRPSSVHPPPTTMAGTISVIVHSLPRAGHSSIHPIHRPPAEILVRTESNHLGRSTTDKAYK
jgi:hypothetical protein